MTFAIIKHETVVIFPVPALTISFINTLSAGSTNNQPLSTLVTAADNAPVRRVANSTEIGSRLSDATLTNHVFYKTLVWNLRQDKQR